MREATFSTLDRMMTDRANTSEIRSSLRFLGERIQRTFPSSRCTLSNGDHEHFIFSNIQYSAELALMMADCSTFLDQRDLKQIVFGHNILMQFLTENAVNELQPILLFLETAEPRKESECSEDHRNGMNRNEINRSEFPVDRLNVIKQRNGHCVVERGKLKALNVNEEFKRLNDAMNDSIAEMNRNCSILQELHLLQIQIGKQLVRMVKYHWK